MGIQKYPSSYGKVKHSIGNIFKNVVKAMYGARWTLEILGEHTVRYMAF